MRFRVTLLERVLMLKSFYPTNSCSLGDAGCPEALRSSTDSMLPRNADSWEKSRTKAPGTILIAEDNEDGLEMLKTLLELKGYRVLEARDGLEAVKIALHQRPDLILLDLQLPSLNGLEVTRQIRQNTAAPNVPILVVSGHNPNTHEKMALAAGCNEYLLKPIDFDRLEHILETFIPPRKQFRIAMPS